MTTTIDYSVAARQDFGAMTAMTPPDPEVPERSSGRRQFSAKYKARILAEYEAVDRSARGALLRLRGNEDVLDVGCGRGAVLLLAAHRLPEGKAVGADIWRRRDQSGNSRAAAEHNAVVEGVRDRVDLVDADARDLPFPSSSFDVVVSNLTIHNIAGTDGRAQALYEAVRVLRAGGRLRIVDLPNADRYAEVLRDGGCVDVTVRRLDWRTWFGVPGHHQTLVVATKSHD
jgi:SAM-dependent methyltransferase